MSTDSPAPGALTRAELELLARLFDRFEYALDPLSRQAKEAESEFNDRVARLFEERVRVHHPQVSLIVFRSHVRAWCRRFLRQNLP